MMEINTDIAVALLAFLGTAFGSTLGVIRANKLTNYRIIQLEEKMNKHNNLIERMFNLEGRVVNVEKNCEKCNK